MNLSIGMITPPVGINLFVGCKISKIQLESTLKFAMQLLVYMLVVLDLTTYIPAVSPADSPWIGASGIPMPDLQIAIVNEDNSELTENQIGEICLKGSFVVDGYENQKSDSITEDGWLKTGDLGYYNQAGYLYIVDRKKDMINRGGEKICSFDIENAIHDLPGIAEAVVVGVPDEKYMEVPAAMVRLEKGETLGAEEIKDMLRTSVARFKIPEYVVFVEDIPKTHNGKIDKRAIREWMKRCCSRTL